MRDVLPAPMTAVPARRSPVEVSLMVALLGTPAVGAAVAAYVAWRDGGVTGLDVGLFLGLAVATSFGIEVGYHRYCSHASFRTGRVFEAIMVGLGTMSLQGSALWWAATHRKHHKQPDVEGDPHSPHGEGTGVKGLVLGLWDAHVGFNLRALDTKDRAVWKHGVPDLMARPGLRALGRSHVMLSLLVAGVAVPAAIGGWVTGTLHGAFTGFLWGGLVRLFVVNNTTYAVNSLGHALGARPFALHARDRSTNNVWLAPFTMGGSLHHNHHVFPAAAVVATRWWQLDVGGLILQGLAKLGVVWDVRVPPQTNASGWTRQVFGSVGGRRAKVTGLTARGAFIETPGLAPGVEAGGAVKVTGLAASDGLALGFSELDGVVERVSWRGFEVRFTAALDVSRLKVRGEGG